MKDIPKNMLKPRKAKVVRGSGECWYYINPGGLEVFAAEETGRSAQKAIRLTRRQLKEALKIMDENREGRRQSV